MMNRLKSVLLSIIPFLRIYSTLQIGSCIRYETYLAFDYKMTPFDLSDNWFSRSHYTPRRLSKISLRSRRIYGCCDTGYKYQGYPDFSCKPICSSPCLRNSHCSQPDQCTCDAGYYSINGLGCVSNEQTSQEYITPTTAEPSSVQPPCNGTCGTNEECSVSNGICVCVNGFQRSNSSSICFESNHQTSTTSVYNKTTTIATVGTPPPCNGSCGTNEECSMTTSDDTCICKDGYHRINSTCEPKCEPECQQASCVAPNTCTCWPHYERTNDTSCRLQCSEQSCVYGNCDPNGVCVCANGFLNNGTACIWAGDAILTEPDNCDCWSKFVWQKNKTEISAHRCHPLCDGDDSIEVTSGCINFKQCQCYEGFLVCHAQMYKCFAAEKADYTTSSTLNHKAEKVAENSGLPMNMTLLIVAFLATILILGAILLIWQKRPNWFNRLRPYNRMDPGQDQLL